MQTTAAPPDTPAPAAPAGHAPRSDATWDLARRDYLAGQSRTQVCDRYGLSPSTFNDRARREGWRRCDQPDPDPVPDDDPEADEPVDCAALADDALIRVRRALRFGRAGEAASWMRLHEKLTARLEAGREAKRRRERVARARGSDGSGSALAPLREHQTLFSSLAGTQIRLSRALKRAELLNKDYVLLAALNDHVTRAFVAAVGPMPPPADPPCSHPSFSVSDDP